MPFNQNGNIAVVGAKDELAVSAIPTKRKRRSLGGLTDRDGIHNLLQSRFFCFAGERRCRAIRAAPKEPPSRL